MAADPVTRKLVSAVQELSRERQEQLFELVQSWAKAPSVEDSGLRAVTALRASGRLDQSYLDLARRELREPPDLATVRAALASIPGELATERGEY